MATALSLISLVVLIGCQEHKGDREIKSPNTRFVTAEAGADPAAVGVARRLDVFQGDIPLYYSLLGFAPDRTPLTIGLRTYIRSDVAAQDRDEFLSFDVESAMPSLLLESSPDANTVISSDLSSAAWIDGCQGFVQQFDVISEGIPINHLLRANSCLFSPGLSANGTTAVFSSARGKTNTQGELVFDDFDSTLYGPVIHDFTNGTALSLARTDVTLGSPALDALVPVHGEPAISADGRRVVIRTGFMPEGFANDGGLIDFIAGLTLVDLDSGEISLIDEHAERGTFCDGCPLPYADDVVFSGDGNIIWFLRPPEPEFDDSAGISRLYRHDITRGETTVSPVDDEISPGTLVTSHDGKQVAYVSRRGTILLNVDTGERISLDRAMRFCEDDRCAFDGYRYVRSFPLTLSADGSTLLISVIPERDDIATPQNTQEIMVLDSSTLHLRRLAPGVDVEIAVIDDDGRTIVFQTDAATLGSIDANARDELFVVQR